LDILEQLEQKVLTTVAALKESREQVQTLQDTNAQQAQDIATLKQRLADAEERMQHRDTALTALQQQYESVKRDNTRLSQDQNHWEAKVSSLMDTLAQSEPA